MPTKKRHGYNQFPSVIVQFALTYFMRTFAVIFLFYNNPIIIKKMITV